MNKTLKVILIRVVAFSTLFLVCFLPLCGLFSGCASPDGMVDQTIGLNHPSVMPGVPSTGAQAGLTPVGSQPDPGGEVIAPAGSGGGGSGGGGTGGIDNRPQTTDGGIVGGTGGGAGGAADGGTDNRQQATETGGTDTQAPLVCNRVCAVKTSCERSKGCYCELSDPREHNGGTDGSCINANICDYCNAINSFKVVEAHKYTNEFGSGTSVTLSWDVNGGTYFRIGKNVVCGGDGPSCMAYTGTVRTASFNITMNTTFWLQVARNREDIAGLGYASVVVPVL